MKSKTEHRFTAEIYKNGINFCVDVPAEITSQLRAVKGYIKVKGTVNGFPFKKNLVPVKNSCYRLFINIPTLKGAKAKVGEKADFIIEQDFDDTEKNYPVPKMLIQELEKSNLSKEFDSLTTARKQEVLKYLNYIKTDETLQKNIHKLIGQLEKKLTVRIP